MSSQTLLMAAAAALSFFLAACDQGPAERAGEDVDEAIEDATDEPTLEDGPAERAGEAAEGAADDAADAVDEARDNDAPEN